MEHITDGAQCPCNPQVISVGGCEGRVIAHNEPGIPKYDDDRVAAIKQAMDTIRLEELGYVDDPDEDT